MFILAHNCCACRCLPRPLKVVYPVLVAGMMCRVIFSRVLPEDGGIAFTPTKEDDYYAGGERRGFRDFSQRVLKGVWMLLENVF